MKAMTAYVLQMRPSIGEPEENAASIVTHLEQAASQGAQLVCFPESCLSGYSASLASEIALPPDHPCIAQIEERAHALGLIVSFGFIEATGGKPFVTHVVSGGDGRIVYRKTHLGPHERDAFQPGDALPVASIDGTVFGVHLCWESHIPEIATTLRSQGAEVLLVPFASGASGQRRRETWMRYLPARAYDNGCFVIACNAFTEKGGGGVLVLGPEGEVLAEEFGQEEAHVVVELDAPLPRDLPQTGMRDLSYFDHRRPELYRLDKGIRPAQDS